MNKGQTIRNRDSLTKFYVCILKKCNDANCLDVYFLCSRFLELQTNFELNQFIICTFLCFRSLELQTNCINSLFCIIYFITAHCCRLSKCVFLCSVEPNVDCIYFGDHRHETPTIRFVGSKLCRVLIYVSNVVCFLNNNAILYLIRLFTIYLHYMSVQYMCLLLSSVVLDGLPGTCFPNIHKEGTFWIVAKCTCELFNNFKMCRYMVGRVLNMPPTLERYAFNNLNK